LVKLLKLIFHQTRILTPLSQESNKGILWGKVRIIN
jgi:hypothetical protein